MPRKQASAFDIATLNHANADVLREIWHAELGESPPSLRAPELLRRELAWRLEARVQGDVDASVKHRLDVLARQIERGAATSTPGSRPAMGSTLVREWDGVSYSVVVLERGFLFQGETYRSLSEIARRITGAHWSGPRFFGLAPDKRKQR